MIRKALKSASSSTAKIRGTGSMTDAAGLPRGVGLGGGRGRNKYLAHHVDINGWCVSVSVSVSVCMHTK
jgi:hypothetical protein